MSIRCCIIAWNPGDDGGRFAKYTLADIALRALVLRSPFCVFASRSMCSFSAEGRKPRALPDIS